LLFRSVDKLFIQSMVAMLPCFLHLASSLFFLGVLSFLFNLNRTIFYVTLFLAVLTTVTYAFFAILSLFQQDSLLDIPLIRLPVSFVAFVFCFFLTMFGDRFNYKIWRAFRWVFKDVGRKVELLASRRPSEIDVDVFEVILDSLADDNAAEKFFRGIPGFFHTKWLDILSTTVSTQTKYKFKQVMNKFIDRTFHSNTVTEDVSCSRLIICLDASHALLGPNESSQILGNILDG